MTTVWKYETCMYGGDTFAIRYCATCGGPLCIDCGVTLGQQYYCYEHAANAYGPKKNGPMGKGRS